VSGTAQQPPVAVMPAPSVVDGDASADRTVIRAATTEIATLPPLPAPSGAAHGISQRTGEPIRPVLLGVACSLLYAGAGIASAGLLKVLWDSATIAGFPTAARVLTWIPDLRPVSFLAIVMVLTVALIGVVVAGSAGVAAYNAWLGMSRARWAGVAAVAVSLLTILLNPLAMVAMAPVAAGAGMLWLPQLTGFFAAWRRIREVPAYGSPLARDVHYGPLPRYS